MSHRYSLRSSVASYQLPVISCQLSVKPVKLIAWNLKAAGLPTEAFGRDAGEATNPVIPARFRRESGGVNAVFGYQLPVACENLKAAGLLANSASSAEKGGSVVLLFLILYVSSDYRPK